MFFTPKQTAETKPTMAMIDAIATTPAMEKHYQQLFNKNQAVLNT